MRNGLVIGVDSSTTSCKVIIFTPDGKRIATGRSELGISTPKPLWYEQSPDSWWRAFVEACQQVVRQVNADQIIGLCIAAQRETFVPVDEDGNPLRDAILWMDERAGEQLGYLANVFDKKQFQSITGKHLSGNLSVVKIAWLKNNEADIFNKTFKFLDVHAYIVQKLTGHYITSWGCADPMGLFDMTQNHWATALMDKIDLSQEQFPSAMPPGQHIGEITPGASKVSGLPVGLPVFAGIGDGQSAGLGAKVVDSMTAYLSLGTSVVSGYHAPSFQTSENFRIMYGGKEGSYFVETVILGGGHTISWYLKNVLGDFIREADIEQPLIKKLETAASEAPPGAQGLLFVPYLNSAMNPYWDPTASGLIIGLRGIHNYGHIYRAILEGIAYEQRLHATGVEKVYCQKTKKYVVVGGGANSNLWCQIIADITGTQVQRAQEMEATALGAGILAAYSTGIYDDLAEASQKMVRLDNAVFKPNEKRHKYYSKIYEKIYRHIYPANRDLMSDLAEIGLYN